MKLKDIFTDNQTKIFVVTDQSSDNELDWIIEPTELELVPEEENIYLVKAKQVSDLNTTDCYMGIMTPERAAEIVIKRDAKGNTIVESIYDQENTTIPAVASDCFGDYNLYYAKENPRIGIEILKHALTRAVNKNVIAEDLGYILRDEGLIAESIEAFKISERSGPSSEYIYWELSGLYEALGQTDKQAEYKQKYIDHGGIE